MTDWKPVTGLPMTFEWEMAYSVTGGPLTVISGYRAVFQLFWLLTGAELISLLIELIFWTLDSWLDKIRLVKTSPSALGNLDFPQYIDRKNY